MRILIIGKLSKVGDVQVKSNYKFQEVQISVTEYDPMTGEAQPPEVYPALIFNDKIDKLKADIFAGKKVQATCWTRSIEKEHNGKTFYNIALNCSDIKEFAYD